MEVKFCSLSSGSSGNCQYVETSNAKILVDSGFSGKKTEELLKSICVNPEDLDAIFVTHEHTDHIKGVGVLSRRYNLPIYANKGTWIGMESKIGNIKDENIKVFNTERFFEFKDLSVYPMSTFHDANDSVGYILFHEDIKISIVTDTGIINNKMVEKMKNSNLYFIESNHDEDMLKKGLYPAYLKKRILGSHGHLSNEDAGEVLANMLSGSGEKVILAHLSKDNNIPELAMDTVTNILTGKGLDVKGDIDLGISFRDKRTCIYKF